MLSSVALSAVGFAVAWWLDSTQGYHVVMSVLLLPLWVVSGAMFPPPRIAWLQTAAALNPMAHGVAVIRARALWGPCAGRHRGRERLDVDELVVLAGFAAAAVALATFVCARRR